MNYKLNSWGKFAPQSTSVPIEQAEQLAMDMETFIGFAAVTDIKWCNTWITDKGLRAIMRIQNIKSLLKDAEIEINEKGKAIMTIGAAKFKVQMTEYTGWSHVMEISR